RERHSFRCICPDSEAETASCCQCAPFLPIGITQSFVLLASCLASIVMVFGAFLLFGWMVSPNGLRNNNADTSMGLPGVSSLESPVEINQTQETKASHYDWKPGAYEVMKIAREDQFES